LTRGTQSRRRRHPFQCAHNFFALLTSAWVLDLAIFFLTQTIACDMKKRLLLVPAIAAVLIWGAYIVLPSSREAVVLEQIQNELPKGSSKDQVYDFLEARAIRFTPYNAGPDPAAPLPTEEREWKRFVTASIRTRRWLPFSPSRTTYVYFFFDENQKLNDVQVEQERNFDVP